MVSNPESQTAANYLKAEGDDAEVSLRHGSADEEDQI